MKMARHSRKQSAEARPTHPHVRPVATNPSTGATLFLQNRHFVRTSYTQNQK